MASTPGITARHSRRSLPAPSPGGAATAMSPSEAWVWSKRDGKKVSQTFSGKGALSAAKTWRSDATRAVRYQAEPFAVGVELTEDELANGSSASSPRRTRARSGTRE